MKHNVALATFHAREPAERLRQRLEAAGIPALIHDESKIERFWFLTPPLAAVHVEVPPAQFVQARQALESLPGDDPLREAVRCPECGSSRIEFPQITRKFLLPVVLRLLIWLGVVPAEYYCVDCHFTWPARRKSPRGGAIRFPRESRQPRRG